MKNHFFLSLAFLFSFLIIGCDSAADDEITSKSQLNMNGDWEISRFIADGSSNNTALYAGMVFTFDNSRITIWKDGVEISQGSCDEAPIDHDEDGNLSLGLDIAFTNDETHIRDLEETWVVLEVSADGNTIQLLEGDSVQIAERMDLRRL